MVSIIIFSIDLTNIKIESIDLYGAMYESPLNKLKKTPTNRKKAAKAHKEKQKLNKTQLQKMNENSQNTTKVFMGRQ